MRAFHYECKPEQTLLYALSVPPELVRGNHHNGRSTVCKLMNEGKNLVGVIDEDPTASHDSYYKRLYQNKISDKHGIIYCEDVERNNRLIIRKPKFEEWLVAAANSSNVRLIDFKLDDNPDELHKILNGQISDLQRLLHHLLNIKNPSVLHLKFLLDGSI